jgi:hypothetical protein
MVGKPRKPIKVNEASNHEIYLNSPNDRQLWDFIQGFLHIILHFINVGSPCRGAITKFDCPQVHFDEVQFTMVLGIKVTNVTTRFHKFFKCRLLVDKIRLAEENPVATAVGTPCFAFESWALGKQSIPPQPMLPDDQLHAFKPAWHCWVIIFKIE